MATAGEISQEKQQLNGVNREDETAAVCDTTSNTPSGHKDKRGGNTPAIDLGHSAEAAPAAISWADMSDDEEEAPRHINRRRSGGRGAIGRGADQDDTRSLGSLTTEGRSRAGGSSSGRSAPHYSNGSGRVFRRQPQQSNQSRSSGMNNQTSNNSMKRTDVSFSMGQGLHRGNSSKSNLGGLKHRPRGGSNAGSAAGRMGSSSSGFGFSNEKSARTGSFAGKQSGQTFASSLGSRGALVKDPGPPYKLQLHVPEDFSRNEVEKCFPLINIRSVEFPREQDTQSAASEKNCIIQLEDFWTYKKVIQDFQGTKFPGKTCMTMHLIQTRLPSHSSAFASSGLPLILPSANSAAADTKSKRGSFQGTAGIGRVFGQQPGDSAEGWTANNTSSGGIPSSAHSDDKVKSRRKMNLSILTAELAEEEDKRDPNIFGVGRPREETLQEQSQLHKKEIETASLVEPVRSPPSQSEFKSPTVTIEKRPQEDGSSERGPINRPAQSLAQSAEKNKEKNDLVRNSGGGSVEVRLGSPSLPSGRLLSSESNAKEEGEISSNPSSNPNVPTQPSGYHNFGPQNAGHIYSHDGRSSLNSNLVHHLPPPTMFLGSPVFPVNMQTGGAQVPGGSGQISTGEGHIPSGFQPGMHTAFIPQLADPSSFSQSINAQQQQQQPLAPIMINPNTMQPMANNWDQGPAGPGRPTIGTATGGMMGRGLTVQQPNYINESRAATPLSQSVGMPVYTDHFGQFYTPPQTEAQRQQQILLVNRWLSNNRLQTNVPPWNGQPIMPGRYMAHNQPGGSESGYDQFRNVAPPYTPIYQFGSHTVVPQSPGGGPVMIPPQVSRTTGIPRYTPHQQYASNEEQSRGGNSSPALQQQQRPCWMPNHDEIRSRNFLPPHSLSPIDRSAAPPPAAADSNSNHAFSKSAYVSGKVNRQQPPPVMWDPARVTPTKSNKPNLGGQEQQQYHQQQQLKHESVDYGQSPPPISSVDNLATTSSHHGLTVPSKIKAAQQVVDANGGVSMQSVMNKPPSPQAVRCSADGEDKASTASDDMLRSAVSTSEILKINKQRNSISGIEPSLATESDGCLPQCGGPQELTRKKNWQKTWASVVGSAPSHNKNSSKGEVMGNSTK